jgi:hypothetical protein
MPDGSGVRRYSGLDSMISLASIILGGTGAVFYRDREALELLIGALPFSCKVIKDKVD